LIFPQTTIKNQCVAEKQIASGKCHWRYKSEQQGT